MQSMRLKKWFMPVIWLLFSGTTWAQAPAIETGTKDKTPTTVLQLSEALNIALKNNLQIQAAQKSARSASWGVKNAFTEFLPTVNIGLSYTRLDPTTLARANAFYDFANDPANAGFLPDEIRRNITPGAYRNAFAPTVSVTQPIFTGGSLLANVNVAEAQEVTAQANLTNTEQQVIYATHQAYFNVLKAQELLAVGREFVQSAEEHLSSAKKQVAAGLRSKTEILRWEVQKANAESFLVRAENALALSQPALNQVLGVDLASAFAVTPVNDVDVEIPATIEERTAVALRKYPGLRVMDANVGLAEAQVKVARSRFTPTLGLAYNYSWEANSTVKPDSYHSWALGIVAQFPIFSSFRDYTNLQRASETKKQVEFLQTDFERGLRLQVLQASLNLETARRQLVITEKAQEQAEENLRILQKSYEVGLASNLDFLDAQNAASQAKWDRVNARYDYLLAKTALAQAMGVLGR